MEWQLWYAALNKPSWTPTGSTIGTIWGLLYPLIALTYGFVFIQILRKKIPMHVGIPFVIALFLNLAFTPAQFWLMNLWLAWIDVVLLWACILWTMVAIWPYSRTVALLQIPYISWVSIALTLQTIITFTN
jgi:translocator protein